MSGLDRQRQAGRGARVDTTNSTPGSPDSCYRTQDSHPGPAGAPRLLKVRLLGAEADCAAAADQLAAWTLERSAPRANRREAGVRVYLTLLIPAQDKPGDP